MKASLWQNELAKPSSKASQKAMIERHPGRHVKKMQAKLRKNDLAKPSSTAIIWERNENK